MIELTGETLTIEQPVAIAENGEQIAALSSSVQDRMSISHEWVKEFIQQGEK